MSLKNKKFTIILVLVILGVLAYAGHAWYEEKMKLVDRGLADPKFPHHEYSVLELMRVNPGGDLNDEMRAEFEKQLKNLPTRTTPQETFDMYIQALKDGDVERAVECCMEKDIDPNTRGKIGYGWSVRDVDKEYLNNIQEEGGLSDWVNSLEKIRSEIITEISKIKKGSTGELEVRYGYRCWISKNEPCYLFFTKDLWGDWKLGGPYLF